MPGGRPTKYGPEVLEAAKAYLENYEAAGDVVPTIVGLACELGIAKSTCYDWASHDDKAEFSDLLTRIENKQERLLLSGSLKGEMEKVISKMMLSKHGWIEKSETRSFNVTISGDDAEL